MKYIAILGHPDCRNKGDEAVLIGLIRGICSIDPYLKIYIPSDKPQYDTQYVNDKKNRIVFFEYWESPFFLTKIKNKFNFIFKRIKSEDIGRQELFKLAYSSCLKSAKFIVFSGKDLFCEDYGQSSLNRWIDQLTIACDVNNNVYLWGVSPGPFSAANEKKFAKLLDKVRCVTAREIKSYQYIKKLTDPKKCYLIPDPAFALTSVSPQNYSLPAKKEDCIRIGFSISGGLIKYRNLDITSYLNIFKKTILQLNKLYNMEVLLIPHVVVGKGNDDYEVSRELKTLLSEYDINSILPPPHLHATVYKYIIESCDFFVGTRTHTMIASLAAGIPTIAIAYSVKSYGIFDDFFSNRRWVINISELTVNSLFELINQLIINQENLKKIISAKASQIKKTVYDGWSLLKG